MTTDQIQNKLIAEIVKAPFVNSQRRATLEEMLNMRIGTQATAALIRATIEANKHNQN